MANGDTPQVSLMDREGGTLSDEDIEAVEVEALPNEMSRVTDIEGIEIIQEDDGGVSVDFDPMRSRDREDDFYDNLAEFLPDSVLAQVSNELTDQYRSNKASRQDWEDAYSKGLELLGFNYEERTEPFRGATGVTHPLLAEAAVQFQAQAFNELLPADGPVRTTVLGTQTRAKTEQASRVQGFMNYYITNVMEEYTPEFDQMLFYLPLAGSTFKKVYFDDALGRPVSKFIPAEHLVVPYESNDLETCPNITHTVRMSLNDLRKQQVSGFYRDITVLPSQSESTSVSDEIDYIDGTKSTGIDYDCTLLECHVDLDLEGYEDTDNDGEPTGIKIPYIVTISEDNGKVLSIRRNYRENDPMKAKIAYFVHYKFLPGFGFYGMGLIHTIGGLSRTATAALRQLIDAGTLSNLPAGFKARGLRIRDDDDPLQPGEFRDVDAPGGQIRDSLMPLPFKGPDGTLFQLLGFVVNAAQRFATITDMKVGDGNQGAAVGTTIAMIEQGARVMSAIHKRLHYAMKIEFQILSRVMSESLPPVYPYEVPGADAAVKAEDFDQRVDVMPVSDPNIFSQSQRIAIAQTELQMAMQAPEIHNIPEVYRRVYDALGVKNVDQILKADTPDEVVPKDPARENMDALENVPLQAFKGQDHMAHIQSHLLFVTGGIAASLPPIALAIQKHILNHVQLMAEEQAEQAFAQQNPNVSLVDQANNAPFQALVAQFVAQTMQQVVALGQQIQTAGQPQEQQGPDPLIGLKQQELQLRAQQEQNDVVREQAELELERQKLAQREANFQQRLASQEAQTQARIDAGLERELLKQRGN
jgi:chaperonin GroES